MPSCWCNMAAPLGCRRSSTVTLPGHVELDNPHSSWGRGKCHLCQLWANLSLAACPCKSSLSG